MHGTLTFFCGKMGSGKSTMAYKLAEDIDTILISEDEWLNAFYPKEIHDLKDYLEYSARIKPLLTPHVIDILNSGVSIVMDFPGNTTKQRSWFKALLQNGNFTHKLIYLEVSDETCLQQIKQRNSFEPERAKFDTEEVFRKVTGYFEAPKEEEGFNIEVISR